MASTAVSRDFYLLIFSRVFTRLGDGFLRILSILLVAAKTKDPMTAGLVLVFRYVCEILINAISGPFIDRIRIRNSMMAAELMRTILSLLLIVAVLGGWPYQLYLALSFLGDFVFIFFKPAADKVVKVTFPKKEGTKVLSLVDGANHLSNIGGYALASFLTGLLGLEKTVLLSPLFFFLSFLLICRFRLPGEKAIDYGKVRKKSYWASQKEGFRYTWSNLPLRMLLIGRSLVAVGRGSFTVLSVVYLADIAKGLSAYGYFESAQSAGKVLVTLFIIPLFFAYRSTFFLTAVSLIIIGLSFFTFNLVDDVVLACAVGAMVGAGQASEAVGIDAIINRYSEAHIQGRAKSTTSFGSRLSGLAAIVAVYFMVTTLEIKAQTLFAWLGFFPFLASLVFFAGWRSEKLTKELRFRIIPAAGAESSFTPAKRLIRMGRGGTCDMVLPDPHVSLLHCLLEVTAEGPLLEDLNSRNGTFVNGERISRVTLFSGDKIKLGGTELVFSQESEEGEEPVRAQAAQAMLHGHEAELPQTVLLHAPAISPEPADEGPSATPPPPLHEAPFRLLIATPDGKELSYPITTNEVFIGRSAQSDLVLRDRQVSRRHCLLKWEENDKLSLEDLDSTFGTFVNEERISEVLLRPGDRIRLGETRMLLTSSIAPPRSDEEADEIVTIRRQDPAFSLIITPPLGANRTYRIAAPRVRIGRLDHCDLVLHDALVSREHGLLKTSTEGLTLEDLNSVNGTYVNGERIDRVRLEPGDVIRMGKTELKVSPAS
jgi:pSer/pThr/pTyr-binding forkhead associated (FHA) protein